MCVLSKGRQMKISQKGLDLIKEFEGCVLHPYKDQKGIPTIGIGSTHYENGTAVKMTDPPITLERAYQLLAYGVRNAEYIVNTQIIPELNQNQHDALVSFVYNTGTLGNHLKKYLNQNQFTLAANEFPKWDHVNGVPNAGLLRRRLAEQALFNTPV
jgi:lysozyme